MGYREKPAVKNISVRKVIASAARAHTPRPIGGAIGVIAWRVTSDATRRGGIFFAIVVIWLASSAAGRAQALPSGVSELPAFEVATIKPSRIPVVVPGQPGGRLIALASKRTPPALSRRSYCSLKLTIGYAWNVKPYQISGPDWITSDTFAVDARMAPGTSAERALLMLQALLRERFRMDLKIEAQTSNVYSLKVAPAGSKLRATDAPANSVSPGTFQIVAPAMTIADLANRLSCRE